MAELLKSNVLREYYPEFVASGGNDAVPVHAVFELEKALVVDDVIEMFVVPPGYVVHDLILGATDLDTAGSAAVELSVGTMLGTPGDAVLANRTTSGDIGDEFIADSNVGQAGGVARMNRMAALELGPEEASYSIGVQVTTAPATGAPSGRVVINALLRPAYRGR